MKSLPIIAISLVGCIAYAVNIANGVLSVAGAIGFCLVALFIFRLLQRTPQGDITINPKIIEKSLEAISKPMSEEELDDVLQWLCREEFEALQEGSHVFESDTYNSLVAAISALRTYRKDKDDFSIQHAKIYLKNVNEGLK